MRKNIITKNARRACKEFPNLDYVNEPFFSRSFINPPGLLRYNRKTFGEKGMIENPIHNEPAFERGSAAWRVWLGAGGCIVLLCGMILVGAAVFMSRGLIGQVLPAIVQPINRPEGSAAMNNTMGDPNAPVHIIEYGDFQCPYCLRFWNETEPHLIEDYVNTGKVFFEYRSLGAFLGEESAWAAEGAYCAGDQGMFWEYHDTLFANWAGENAGNFSKERLIQFAKPLNLDMAQFESCLMGGKHKKTVEQDAAEAEAAGVRATPTFFINGFKVEGAQPYSVFRELIEEALRQKPSL
jgi:hypothetical protein